MSEIPTAEKRELEGMLHATHEPEARILGWGGPQWISLGLGPRAGSRIPRAAIVLQHAATAVQTARYHLYMAHYERVRHHKYLVPPNIGGGNIAAYFNCTSFALHAIAAERHIRLALVLQHRINKALDMPKATSVTAPEVVKYLRGQDSPYADVLAPFGPDPDWRWLTEYRHRYEHEDPMLVEELGLQHRLRSQLWETEEDSETGRSFSHLSFTAGDKPETNVPEMLGRGVTAFNLLGRQFDLYVRLLEEEISRNWRTGRR